MSICDLMSPVLRTGPVGLSFFCAVVADAVLFSFHWSGKVWLLSREIVRLFVLLGFVLILRAIASVFRLPVDVLSSGDPMLIFGIIGEPYDCLILFVNLILSLAAVWLILMSFARTIRAFIALRMWFADKTKAKLNVCLTDANAAIGSLVATIAMHYFIECLSVVTSR